MKINEDIAKGIIALYVSSFLLGCSTISKISNNFKFEHNNQNTENLITPYRYSKSLENTFLSNQFQYFDNEFILKNISIKNSRNKINESLDAISEFEFQKRAEVYNNLPYQLKKLNNLDNGEYVFWIDKINPSLSVYQNSSYGLVKIEEFPASTGKNQGNKERRGDNKTPEGLFEIISIEESSNWVHWSGKKNAYGPNFLRLKTGFKGIGIHGTNEPHLLGKNISEGCIRLSNENLIYLLDNYAKAGTKVIVSYTNNKINSSNFEISYNQNNEVVKNVE
jgi:murein L,D-transpeptidase YafK